MSRKQSQTPHDPLRAVKKLLLSTFVVFAFGIYVAYERVLRPELASVSSTGPTASSTLAPFASATGSAPSFSSQASPTASGGASAAGYRNGTFTGPPVDAYYGLVQVQVSIKGGSIKDVEFLQYPNDRQTSQQINSIAMPYLKQEALQAQSAQVDIISGATLTSEGFQLSLQSALQSAHN